MNWNTPKFGLNVWLPPLLREDLGAEIHDVEHLDGRLEAMAPEHELAADANHQWYGRPWNCPSPRVGIAKRVVVASGLDTTRPFRTVVTVAGPNCGSAAAMRVTIGPDQMPLCTM